MHEIGCSQCEFCVKLFDVLRSYGTADACETSIGIRQRWAWCDACQTVVWAERIDDLDVIRSELDWPDWPDADEKKVEQRLAWRRDRRSPARCLECGSSEIHPFSDEQFSDEGEVVAEEQLEHPGCGGTLAVREVGFGLSRQWIFYTPEGERIEVTEASPSRGLVRK